ncbi:MAG: T9SS type A sorting domain-containing protein [Paludibacteraceae bacterium]|nr:T9SS type A sorting domain-containing protein [Paludibacteraceae bacterium]
MRQKFLSLLAAVLLMLPATLKAQELKVVLSEGFETGIPATWQNTTDRETGALWATESGASLVRPAGAAVGNSRAYLRNTTGKTIGFKTKLITPVLDLSGASNWVVRFRHAQVNRSVNTDVLRVYRRNSPTADWVLLAEYTAPITGWTQEMIPLPQVSATYQLAFEGADNNAWGVVLDDVIVQEEPSCTTPHDLSVSALTATSAKLIWIASYDANNFQVVVFEGDALTGDALDSMDPSTALINKTTADGITFDMDLTGLEKGTKYTAYVRSHCDGEISDWGVLTFSTRMVKDLPYTENFELAANSKMYVVNGWTHLSNTGDISPVVPTNNTATQVNNMYGKHAGNYALAFFNSPLLVNVTSSMNGIPKDFINNATGQMMYMKPGQWSCAAAPEVNADLKNCQVRFWASVGAASGVGFAKTLKVGVMTDPNDITTFSQLSEIKMWAGTQENGWNEYIVSFADYAGSGKYVAFMSQADAPNVVFVDDVTIEAIPAVTKVTKQGLTYENGKVYLTWEAAKGASSYNVIIGNKVVANPATLTGAALLYSTTAVTDTKLDLSVLTKAGEYAYAYVQAVGSATAEWSNFFRFVVPALKTPPMFFGFEESEGQAVRYQENYDMDFDVPAAVATYSNDEYLFPYVSKKTKTYNVPLTGQYCLTTEDEDGYGMYSGSVSWIVFPPVDRPDTLSMNFYMATQADYARVVVGVMEDPTDYYSFDPIATFTETEGEYTRFNVSFADYTGKGHFIAIHIVPDPDMAMNKLFNDPVIDDVSIGGLPECAIPQNLRMTASDNAGFTLQWDAAGGSFYELIVADKILSDTELDAATSANIMVRKQNITARSITLPYDAKLVQGKTYYAYVRSSCEQSGGKVSNSLWSASAELQLPLPAYFPLPYLDDFESYPASSVPTGWNRLSNNSQDKLTGTAGNHTAGGKQGMYFYSNATTTTFANIGGYVSAPRFAIDDNDLNNLLITFWGKAVTAQSLTASTIVIDSLYIGTMVNPNDETTFTKLAAVEIKTTAWTQYTVAIQNWTPSLGEYVTFTTRHELFNNKTTNNNLYVDDIEFASIVNGKPFDLAISGVDGDKAVFSWGGKSTNGWKVIVSTENVANASDLEGGNTVVFSSTVNTPTVQLTGLAAQTHYFAYVKPVTADNEKWASVEFLSACMKLNPKNTYFMDFENLAAPGTATGKYADIVPDCWTSYNVVASAGVNYLPGTYVYAANTVLTETSYVHSGLASFYVYGQNATSGLFGPSVLATPEIDGNVADWTVSFWAKPSSNSYRLHFGVMTDPNDITTFTKLGEDIYVGKTVWTKFKYNLSELGYKPEMGQYIAFRSPVNADGTVVTGGAYLDEIVLTTSKCSGPEITFSNLTNNSVAVRTAIEDGTVNMILVKDLNAFDLTALNADVDAYLASLGDKVVARRALANAIGENLTGLTEATAYAIALQGSCSDGSVSPWSVGSFATMGAPKTPEEFGVYDFEDYAKDFGETNAYHVTAISANGENTLMPGWARGNESKQGYWPLIFWNTASTAANYQMAPAGQHCLHLASTSTYNGSYAIMPALNLPDEDIVKYRVNMKTRVSGNSVYVQAPTSSSFPKDGSYANSLIVGLITDPADLSTFIPIDTLKIPADGVSEQEVRFSRYKGDNNGKTGKHLMFRSYFSLPNYVYVDDIQFTLIPECTEPIHLKASDVTEGSAVLTWQSELPTVRVMIATESLEEGARMSYMNYVVNEVVNGSRLEVKKLNPNTYYYVYIMSECGGKQYWGQSQCTFMTACGAAQQLPYYENFDNYTPPTSNNNMKPNCWITYYNNLAQTSTSTRYPQISAAAKYGDTGNGFYFYATKNSVKTEALRATGVSPAIAGDISKTMISFRYRNMQATNTNPAMLLVALTKDNSSIANIYKEGNFFVVDTIRMEAAADGTVWYEYRKELSAFSGENMYIVLSALNETVDGIQYYNPTYIDDFAVEEIPTCFTPANLSVTDIRPESAVLHFDAYRAEDKQWDVAVVESGSFDVVPVTYDTTDVVLTNLKPLTSYNVLVRTHCAADDQSAYVQTAFTTLDKITADRFFGFENDEEAVRTPGASGDYYKISRSLTVGSFDANGNPVVSDAYNPYNAAGYQRTGERALQLRNAGSYRNAYVLLPEISDAASKQIRFDMRAVMSEAATIDETATAPFAVLEVGVVPAYGDAADFTTLAAFKASAYTAGEAVTEAKNLLFDQVVLQLPDLTGKQLALRLATPEAFIYVDNLYVEAAKGYTTPVIKGNSVITPTTLTFEWEAKADTKWNVYLTDNADVFPFDAASAVKKVEATDKTSVTFEGLTPDKQYYAFLQVAGQTDAASVSARRAYKTPSDVVKLPLNTVIDFEEGLVPRYQNTDAYQTLAGLTTGNALSVARNAIPYVIADAETEAYSLSATHALVLQNTSARSMAYAVAPLIASDRLDTLQVNFRGRIFKAVGGKAEGSTTDAPFLPLTVGTVTDPNDIATFEPIARLTYGNTKVTYESDAATGDKLFEKFSFRLAGAKGQYVAFVFDTVGTWYIDNLEVGSSTCIAPVGLKTVETGVESAKLTWMAFDDAFVQVQIASDDLFSAESLVKDETMRGDTCAVEGLGSGMTYYWRIRQVCGEADNSDWSAVATFNTVCKAGTTYATGFEAADGWLPVNERETGADALLRPFCWTVGYDGALTTSTAFNPYVAVNNGGAIWYSHDNGEQTNKAALRLTSLWDKEAYRQQRGAQRSWAVMPEVDADLNDMEVSFWMSVAEYNNRTEAVSTSYYTATSAHAIYVGTVTDPADISTFEPIELVRYDGDSVYTGIAANADNNYRFIKYTVQLKGAKGKYVTFMSDSYAFREACPWLKETVSNTVFIDDVAIAPASGCVTPGKRETLNVNTTTALLRWSGTEGADFRVTVASDQSFAESTIVVTDTVSEMEYALTGLVPSTRYYWRVAQLCEGDASSAESPAASFITLRAPFFYENFEKCVSGKRVPDEWTSVTMPASEVFKGKKLPSTPDFINSWGSVSGSNTITHMTTKLNSTPNSGVGIDYVYAWLVSPSFLLGEDMPAWLSFNVSVNNQPSGGVVSYGPYETNGYDDQFMVIVSDDNGETWKRENAIVWNNETDTSTVHFYGNGDYSFNSLPYEQPDFSKDADRIFIDLAKYKGKSVKIAFYTETTVPNARNRMRLWDVRMAYYYNDDTEYAKCLYAEDYEWKGYTVNSTTPKAVEPGNTTYTTIAYAPMSRLAANPTDPMVDTVYTLNATVWDVPETVYEREICEGYAYSDENFENLTEARDYNKYLSTVNGCDSLITLRLIVRPSLATEQYDTLCVGQTFRLGDKEYTQNTVVYDTIRQAGAEFGCDSIVKHVVVFEAMTPYEYDAQSCHGVPYYFTAKYPALTVEGRYIDTVKTADLCDSVVIVNLTFPERITYTQELFFCPGGSVTYEGKTYSEETDDVIILKDDNGCETEVTVKVRAAQAYNIVIDAKICEGNAYTLNGFNETEPGQYTHTGVSAEGCDSVTVLNLSWYDGEPVLVDDTVTVEELPYNFSYLGVPVPGITYPKGTEPGVYNDTATVNNEGGCEIQIIHKLTIIPATGLQTVERTLLITPNYISRGESVSISGFEGQEGMKVEVYDMTGKRVSANDVTMAPVQVDGFHAAGIYTVRLVTADGDVFTGRVIVR